MKRWIWPKVACASRNTKQRTPSISHHRGCHSRPKSRHIQFIALRGTIETGLFPGIGKSCWSSKSSPLQNPSANLHGRNESHRTYHACERLRAEIDKGQMEILADLGRWEVLQKETEAILQNMIDEQARNLSLLANVLLYGPTWQQRWASVLDQRELCS